MTGRTRIERIDVRGGETVEERVLETRHGPIIGPAIRGETRAVALRSTAIEPGDPLAPVLELCRATNVEDFDAAVGRRPGVPFNYVYASRDGHIGYRMSGSIPAREHGEGLLPQDGARSPGPPPPARRRDASRPRPVRGPRGERQQRAGRAVRTRGRVVRAVARRAHRRAAARAAAALHRQLPAMQTDTYSAPSLHCAIWSRRPAFAQTVR